MRLSNLNDIPFEPVSHNPELKKQVLIKEGFSCIRHFSHIVFKPGDTAVEHTHDQGYEVFYCIRGEILFMVGGKEVLLEGGSFLVVEPREPHSLRATTEAEMVYFFALL